MRRIILSCFKKSMISFLLFSFIGIILTPIFTKEAFGKSCSNRYATLINPVRGRDLWREKNLSSFQNQYGAVNINSFSATWLLQYDVLSDKELLDEIMKMNENQELGVFLEISEKLSNDSRVIYSPHKTWFDPSIVFLSGYSQSERKKLIDKLFKEFKKNFGIYPKSVGAWWIDSYSLNYMNEKYGISSALIVADQKTTDNYGVWGQWWGVPYYPSKANILTPASDIKNKQDIVILQWAQRDPLLAFGETLHESNFSLQANDYLRQGLDINYFREIIDVYLNCSHKIGQVTVGLETGIESVGNINEYKNQLEVLRNYPNLKSVTMSEFSNIYSDIYQTFPEKEIVSLKDSSWFMNTKERKNEKFNELIIYNNSVSFADYFIQDNEGFLNRVLKTDSATKKIGNSFPWYLILVALFGVYLIKKGLIRIWILSLVFLFSAYGLILKSQYLYGWAVYHGPVIKFLEVWQAVLAFLVFLFFLLIYKFKKINIKLKEAFILFLPLSFAIDVVAYSLRYSYISGFYYLGFALDSLKFLGISFSKNFEIKFHLMDQEAYQALAMLRIDADKIYTNNFLYIFVNPLIHIIFTLIILFVYFKLPRILQKGLFIVFLILFCLYIVGVINADPKIVLPL